MQVMKGVWGSRDKVDGQGSKGIGEGDEHVSA